MAEKSQIIDAIEALAIHCRPPLMGTDQRPIWLREWADDLSEFPLEAITNATRKWRQSGNTKFPTSGQLIPLIREQVPSDRPPAASPWRKATPGEFADMSIEDKIRELGIQRHNLLMVGGPMFRNTSKGASFTGEHIPPEAMPPEWHDAQREAREMGAEIKRLRGVLNEARERQRLAA